MNDKFFQDVAKMVNLSPMALTIYLTLKQHGELSSEMAAEINDVPHDKVQEAISELTRGNFIRPDSENPKMYFARTLLELQNQAEESLRIVENLRNFFPKISSFEKKKFFQFEGWNEIKNVYSEALKTAIAKKTDFYAFENNFVNSELGQDFVKNYIELRKKNKITAHVICPNSRADRKYKKDFEGKYTKVKLIEGLNIDENINIVGDIVVSFSADTLKGAFQRDISKATTLRSLFEHIWNNN